VAGIALALLAVRGERSRTARADAVACPQV